MSGEFSLSPFSKAARVLVDRLLLRVDLGRSAPDHDGARGAGALAEAFDVPDEGLGEVHLRLWPFLTFGPSRFLTHVVLEDRRHRPDRLELGLHRREHLRRQHAGLRRRLVGVVRENVPAAENEVRELRQRHELLHRREARLRALAEPELLHLGHRAERPGEPLADQVHAGDQRRGHGAEARQQHGQLALRGRDLLFQLGIERGPVRHEALLRIRPGARTPAGVDAVPRRRSPSA